MVKRYHLSNINKNIKSVKWVANKKKLEDTESIYFDLKKIHNVKTT